MNIFVLHENPILAARLMYDKHVTKMPLEASQLLSFPIRLQFGTAGWLIKRSSGRMESYPLTLLEEQESDQLIPLLTKRHVNHPCAKWVRESYANYRWLLDHAMELCHISAKRSGREPRTYTYLIRCEMWLETLSFPYTELTPFANCTGSILDGDIVETYRNYYRKAKAHLACYGGKKYSFDERLSIIMSTNSRI